jgi:hypothetical protein
MVKQLGKLFKKIDEFDTDQETKEGFKYIFTSVSEKYLSHIKCIRRVHATTGNPLTGTESSLPTSPTYLPGTEPMVSPAGPSIPTALPIEEEAKDAEQSFTACYDNYYLIHRNTKDSAWYPQRHRYAFHSGGPANHHLRYLEPLLPCHANHHGWMRPQEPILGDSGHLIYCLVTRSTEGLSFANDNNVTRHG